MLCFTQHDRFFFLAKTFSELTVVLMMDHFLFNDDHGNVCKMLCHWQCLVMLIDLLSTHRKYLMERIPNYMKPVFPVPEWYRELMISQVQREYQGNSTYTERKTHNLIHCKITRSTEFEFIGVLRHMQRYFSHICDGTDVYADCRRSCTCGRAPNAIDISQDSLTCPSYTDTGPPFL